MTKRVAIIGAGPCGMSALRAFATARNKGEAIPDIVCFERQRDWGGLWNYTWRTGLDEFGEPVHSSMYRYLWSNGPKECLEFSDYSFDEHFGRPIPSFPPREPLADYIKGRAEKSDIRKYVRFTTAVRWIDFQETTGKFTVVTEDLTTNHKAFDQFDNVIVATGHFSVPNVPEFEGIQSFPGRVLHAHDFRSANEFAGRDLLIVGASYSAEDIGLQCHKYGAKSVTMSWRTAPMGFDWPEGMEERELLTRIDGRTVHFKDGSSKEFDAIILCTGYKHHFPFLSDALRLETTNRLYSPGLYKGVVWAAHPGLLYLGMQDQWYTFTMFDAEAWFARDVIMGKIELPSQAEMEADMAKWAEKEAAADDASKMITFQTDYIKELMSYTDYPKFDIDSADASFKVWKGNKSKGILTYRDYAHPSPVTGTMSPTMSKPWIEQMDDSMETFLKGG